MLSLLCKTILLRCSASEMAFLGTKRSPCSWAGTRKADFSVVLFRPNFMLASEKHPMKAHKNQGLSNLLSPTDILCGATNQGTHPRSWGADALAVT
jgi:hypothetical protein